MSGISAFATARLDEDEAAAKKAIEMGAGVWALAPHFHTARHGPARVLREVESGRRILERHRPDQYGCQYCCPRYCTPPSSDPALCPDLADLLYRWAGHPDYDQEWKP